VFKPGHTLSTNVSVNGKHRVEASNNYDWTVPSSTQLFAGSVHRRCLRRRCSMNSSRSAFGCIDSNEVHPCSYFVEIGSWTPRLSGSNLYLSTKRRLHTGRQNVKMQSASRFPKDLRGGRAHLHFKGPEPLVRLVAQMTKRLLRPAVAFPVRQHHWPFVGTN